MHHYFLLLKVYILRRMQAFLLLNPQKMLFFIILKVYAFWQVAAANPATS